MENHNDSTAGQSRAPTGREGDAATRQHQAIERLQFAMDDHQEAIRGSDLKAEVLGIVVTAVFAVVELEGELGHTTWNGSLGLLAIVCAFGSFFSIGGVLWPRSNPWKTVKLEGYTPTGVLYPDAAVTPGDTIKRRVLAALDTDWLSELTYELAKLSHIHKRKRQWMRFALGFSGAAILLAGVRLLLL